MSKRTIYNVIKKISCKCYAYVANGFALSKCVRLITVDADNSKSSQINKFRRAKVSLSDHSEMSSLLSRNLIKVEQQLAGET